MYSRYAVYDISAMRHIRLFVVTLYSWYVGALWLDHPHHLLIIIFLVAILKFLKSGHEKTSLELVGPTYKSYRYYHISYEVGYATEKCSLQPLRKWTDITNRIHTRLRLARTCFKVGLCKGQPCWVGKPTVVGASRPSRAGAGQGSLSSDATVSI